MDESAKIQTCRGELVQEERDLEQIWVATLGTVKTGGRATSGTEGLGGTL